MSKNGSRRKALAGLEILDGLSIWIRGERGSPPFQPGGDSGL